MGAGTIGKKQGRLDVNNKNVFACSFLFCFLLTACSSKPILNAAPDLYNYDLVFQKIENNSQILVFYDIESNRSYDLVFNQTYTHPVASSSDDLLLSLSGPTFVSGYPVAVDLASNNLKDCPRGWVNFWMAQDPQGINPYDIILSTPSNVYRFDLNSCEIKDVLIEFDDYRESLNYYGGLMGFSITPDGKQLYIGRRSWTGTQFTLHLFDIDENELSEMGEGISPSVSNGGNLLAYFMHNGLYLLDLTTQITKKLLDFPEPDSVYPPQIYWSSDDTKLLFHFEPDRKEGDLFNDLEMIVFDLEKMEKTTLPIKGLYPSWIQ